jgi:ankyrin repeat protein
LKLLLTADGVLDRDSKNTEDGQTSLTLAAVKELEAVVELLGNSPNYDNDDAFEETPLSWAAANGLEELVKLLLATNGVDPDSKNDGAGTPLLWAATNGHEVVVKLLLRQTA